MAPPVDYPASCVCPYLQSEGTTVRGALATGTSRPSDSTPLRRCPGVKIKEYNRQDLIGWVAEIPPRDGYSQEMVLGKCETLHSKSGRWRQPGLGANGHRLLPRSRMAARQSYPKLAPCSHARGFDWLRGRGPSQTGSAKERCSASARHHGACPK